VGGPSRLGALGELRRESPGSFPRFHKIVILLFCYRKPKHVCDNIQTRWPYYTIDASGLYIAKPFVESTFAGVDRLFPMYQTLQRLRMQWTS
jgi:hypothetical protein